MAIYTIGDLHLSLGSEDKPMDIFEGWSGYLEKLEKNWRMLIGPEDHVVLPGDFCWAMDIKDSCADFQFLQDLPGKKILLKGNHDYWWTTMNKMRKFLEDHGYDSIQILQNQAFLVDGVSICGTRGWLLDASDAENTKILNRELLRLRMSLEAAETEKKYVFLHYPPLYADNLSNPFTELLQQFHVEKCFYGHLHGKSVYTSVQGRFDGVDYKLVSADSLKFCPYKIS